MKIAYITPYAGEEPIVNSLLSNHEVTFINEPICDKVPDEISDCEVLSIFVDSKVPAEIIDSLPNLKIIAARSTGYDHIDVAHATEKGIVVTSVPHYGSQTVAEHTFALLLALSRKVYPMYNLLRSEGALDVEKFEGFDLCGKTLGIIGTGAIGKRVADIALGFKMNVLTYDLYPDVSWAESRGIEYLDLHSLVKQIDFLTLHVPATDENHHIINSELLSTMKTGGYLINTARGTLVDTVALTNALKQNILAGAGLDVYEGEEYLKDEMKLLDPAQTFDESVFRSFVAEHELLDMPNVIITPHMAFNTKEAKREITETTAQNILLAQTDAPQFVVKV